LACIVVVVVVVVAAVMVVVGGGGRVLWSALLRAQWRGWVDERTAGAA
jgi:hypothetical protein